jgi:predicted dehydrogenase
MKKINLGIIGLGSIGTLHLDNCLKLSNANVVAVSDTSKKAQNVAKRAGIKKIFGNYEQLLSDTDIDAVIIALPTHLHLDCAVKAAEMKKHILLEKPIAINVSDAREIVSASQRNSIKLMVGYPLRFNPIFYALKQKIESGCLGDIVGAYATNVGSGPFFERAIDNAPLPVPEWWFNKSLTGGGVLMDLGSHMINLLRWYFGEITDIRSQLDHKCNLDFEDSATCLAKFSSGTTAVIWTGWFSQELQLKVELLGTVAHAKEQIVSKNNFLLTASRQVLTGNSSYQSPHLSEVNYFVNCLLHDSNPSPSGLDGLKDIEAISLAYKNELRLS